MELTEQHDNGSVASEDMISLDALSAKELSYIVKNPKYTQLLTELLHGLDQAKEGALPRHVNSADNKSTKGATGKGTDHTSQTEREPSRGTQHSSIHHYRKREQEGRSESSESS